MKRIVFLIVAVIMVMTSAKIFYAEDTAAKEKGAMTGEEMKSMPMKKHDMMMKEKGMSMGCCPLHGMMMKGMMEKKMVATSDDGIVILTCHKLMKYDKDLNLVKEVEIKADMESMKKMMTEMKEKCPQCQRMQGCMGEGKEETKKQE
jgi:hypothetical protein